MQEPLARGATQRDTLSVFQVPQSVQRLAMEIEGWLDLECPDHAILKLADLLAVPGARPAALSLRVRAYVATARYQEAVVDIDEIRHFDHDPEWADLTEAWCRKRLDDLAAAIQCMERLVARTNHSAIGHFNLGCYLALAGNSDSALDEITLACGIDPAFRQLLAEESDLVSLHERPEFQALLRG